MHVDAVVVKHVGAEFDRWIEELAVPHRARRAYWHLVLSGEASLEAVRAGLCHTNPDVRMYCARALDHLADPESFGDLVAALTDPAAQVRVDALHAIACDRCKDTACRPDAATVLPIATTLLLHDPDKHVRIMAAEVVGRWVHTDRAAAEALIAARDGDPEPSVRKKAGWYAPGGTIHKKTAPRSRRTAD